MFFVCKDVIDKICFRECQSRIAVKVTDSEQQWIYIDLIARRDKC